MNRFFWALIFGITLLVSWASLVSCTSGQVKNNFNLQENPLAPEESGNYTIENYKGKENGGGIPEWVNLFLEDGARGVETLDAYKGSYVFVSRNVGNNFKALSQWSQAFSPELDFPRLAAARIEARFIKAVPFPDNEYGSFYEALVRAASDAYWTGAVRVDDFWFQRKYDVPEDEAGNPVSSNTQGTVPDTGQDTGQNNGQDYGQGTVQDAGQQAPQGITTDIPVQNETWEFLILVTIDENVFSLQLNDIFQNLKPSPLPAKDQIAAANRVKEKFFEGF